MSDLFKRQCRGMGTISYETYETYNEISMTIDLTSTILVSLLDHFHAEFI